MIESPNFPQPYPHNRNCSWTIKAPRGNTINMTFSNFELEDHHSQTGNCTYDHLTVTEMDGRRSDNNVKSLGRFCGERVPSLVSSTKDKVILDFVSDYSVAENGFRLEWVVEGCGGRLTKPTDSFSTPNWPLTYGHSVECIWSIEVDPGSKVELNITEFQLEGHENCDYDYLAVYAGASETSPQLIKMCDAHSQNTVVSSMGNTMLVKFVSDYSKSSKGFIATYTTKPGGCGGLMKGREGKIVSPNYPQNYDPHDDCGWLLEVDKNHVVKFTFEDFDVEPHESCEYDFVALYDGNSTDSQLILKHCGQNLPNPVTYTSTGNQMFVRLKADGSIASKGFKANFTRGCGARIVTSGQGVLTSPDYPHFWAENENCSWVIQGSQPTDRVTLHVTYMDLDQPENFYNCSDTGGNLAVRDGEDANAPLIGRYCGMVTPPSITTQGSRMFIKAQNNVYGRSVGYSSYNTFQRFRAIYTVEDTACGGHLHSLSGIFASPSYPESYPVNVECVWTIEAPAGNLVHLFFEQFNIEDSDSCNKDYVDIFVNGPEGEHVGRFCGEENPPILPSANRFWIKFNSDALGGTGTGFTAQYGVQYGSDVTGSSGEIESIDYPHLYLNLEEHTVPWTITVTDGRVIEITFVDFELERSHPNLCNDELRVLDGATDDAPVIFRGCGNALPDTLVSSSNTARILLKLTASRGQFGSKFKLRWRESERTSMRLIPSGNTTLCGGKIILGATNYTYLSSPGYPTSYPNHLNCEWIVEAPADMRIKLRIIRMQLGNIRIIV